MTFFFSRPLVNKVCHVVRRIDKSAMSTSAGKKFNVLRFGPIVFTDKAWKKFAVDNNANIIDCHPKNRQEFISDLRSGKYADVDFIARTFTSANWTGLFDEELAKELKEHTNLKGIAHNGAGYDQVDAVAFGKLGIQVANVPNLVDAATADTHIYLLLGAERMFGPGARKMLEGNWPKSRYCYSPMGHDPEGKVIGILGMGGIGRAIRDKLQPFHPKEIIYHNRRRLSEDLEGNARYVSFDDLLKESDIISISIPLNKNTKYMINKKTISQMKKGVVIVNTARGAVIKEEDLIPALKSGKVGAFGADVWENEPNANPELYSLPTVLALPHLGTYTYETGEAMELHVIKNVEHFIKTGKVLSMVPELQGKF